MKLLVFALVLLGTSIALSPITRAATVVVQEYNWDHTGIRTTTVIGVTIEGTGYTGHGEHIFITVH
jgi:hypothetical protein